MRASSFALVASAAILLSGPLAAQGTIRHIVSIDGHARPIALDTMGVRLDLPTVAPAQAWEGLAAVYDDAKIATSIRSTSALEIGNLVLVQRGGLWKAPLSRFFDCGSSMSGNNADTYRISIALISWIVPNGAGSTVWTAVAAGGRDLSGSSNHARTCQSLGQLEGTIHDALKERVTGRATQSH
jgi:hypothetical protein